MFLVTVERDGGRNVLVLVSVFGRSGLSQLDKLVEKQRETHRRMLEQLLMVEQAHKQALYKLEDEKRNHGEFMKKSDEFTNLLEQERERSVSQG